MEKRWCVDSYAGGWPSATTVDWDHQERQTARAGERAQGHGRQDHPDGCQTHCPCHWDFVCSGIWLVRQSWLQRFTSGYTPISLGLETRSQRVQVAAHLLFGGQSVRCKAYVHEQMNRVHPGEMSTELLGGGIKLRSKVAILDTIFIGLNVYRVVWLKSIHILRFRM